MHLVQTPPFLKSVLALLKIYAKSRWMKQLAFRLKTWGGARKGAGRKPSGVKARVSHLRRPRLSGRHPVHVTLKMLPGVGYLRQFSRARQIDAALAAPLYRFRMKLRRQSIH